MKSVLNSCNSWAERMSCENLIFWLLRLHLKDLMERELSSVIPYYSVFRLKAKLIVYLVYWIGSLIQIPQPLGLFTLCISVHPWCSEHKLTAWQHTNKEGSSCKTFAELTRSHKSLRMCWVCLFSQSFHKIEQSGDFLHRRHRSTLWNLGCLLSIKWCPPS